MTRLMLINAALIVLVGCGDRPSTDSGAASADMPDTTGARNLLATYCTSCHGGEGSGAVAPSFREIHDAYEATYKDPRSYVDVMAAFIVNPSKANALMGTAVATYGPMPNMGYRPDDARKMAALLFAVAGEQVTEPGVANEPNDLLERYRQYALGTKAVLGKNLLAAIQEYGPAGAVDFCSTRAIPITDSMAVHYGVRIRRVSEKPRNQRNKANSEEAAFISALRTAKAKGEKPPDGLRNENGRQLAYFSIETNSMCLQCHGRPGVNIKDSTLRAIILKYPEDLAVGYGENEIRGIWVVEQLTRD